MTSPIHLTERRDLRGGEPVWVAGAHPFFESDSLGGGSADIVIVGAGITGASIAERLTGLGRDVIVVDRRPPAHGSTAASTALLMWAADIPLKTLSERIGVEEAARRWRRVNLALADLSTRIEKLGIDCGLTGSSELYLSGTMLDEDGLAREAAARTRAGLPSELLDPDSVAGRFGIVPRAGLLSTGAFVVDPVRLTAGLLAASRARGARLLFPADALRIEQDSGAVIVHFSNRPTIRARHVILASGYERATLFLPPAFTIGATFAIATATGLGESAWNKDVMIWEASERYFYARKDADGRVLAGGEDGTFSSATLRNAQIAEAAASIERKLLDVTGRRALDADLRWAADFGSSPDGLPAIGRVQGYDNLWLAGAFGGNGMTFAALAADLIAADMAGEPDPDAAGFSPYRFG